MLPTPAACRGKAHARGWPVKDGTPAPGVFPAKSASLLSGIPVACPSGMAVHARPALIIRLATAVVPFIWASFSTAAATGADRVVEIRALGRYFVEPANISVTVDVEPDSRNRLLRFEADSDNVYRATEIALDGEHATRVHVVQFKGLPAGRYVLRAEVRSEGSVRGTAEGEVLVMEKERNQ